jgi:phosphatidylglycerophosphate synthase
MFDGLLARKFHWESNFGAKLDGFADIALILSVLVVVLLVLKLRFKSYVLICVGGIALVRAVNLLFTRIKFKQWSTMHSFLIRYTAVPIYLIAPILVWTGNALNELVMTMLIAILVSVLEETWILALLKDYDMNTKSIWHAWKQKTLKKANG